MTTEQVIEQFRQIVEHVRRNPPSPEQMERMRRFMDELNRLLQTAPAGGGTVQPQGPARPAPTQGQMPAPQRVFRYDVTIGSGASAVTYRVTLPRELPAGSERATLLNMASNHEFFSRGPSGPSRVTTPNVPAPRAMVEQVSGPGKDEFNGRPQAAQVDTFEVALNRAREAGSPLVVASSPAPIRRGG